MKLFALLIVIIFFAFPLYSQGDAGDVEKEKKTLKQLEDDGKFENGMHLIRLGRQEKGMLILQEYLEIYYNGNHRYEAYREIARVRVENFDYQQAVKVYSRMYEEFGDTEEGVEGFYNMGICYQKMGYRKKAREVFRAIVEHHSETSFARQASLQLDLLNILADERGNEPVNGM